MGEDKKKVLIIEDEKLLADAIEKALSVLDINVNSVHDGGEGLKTALTDHPDLILLDMVLPTMDGITILDNLRKDDWGKSVPVIVLSNLNKHETVEEGKNRGVSDYLVKTDWKLSDIVKKVKDELGIK